MGITVRRLRGAAAVTVSLGGARLDVKLYYGKFRRAFGWGRLPGMEGGRYWELGQVDVYYYGGRGQEGV